MTWTWTLEDKQHFQRLRRAIAGALLQMSKGYIGDEWFKDVARAHKRAVKATFPTNDDGQVRTLRQWLTMAQSLVESPREQRRLHAGALSLLQAQVADILGPSPDPYINGVVDAAEAEAQKLHRSAYWLD